MNIAYITPEFVTEKIAGGLATYLDNISTILADRGHKVTIITLSDKNEIFEYYPNVMLCKVKADTSHVDIDVPTSIAREQSRVVNRMLSNCMRTKGAFDIVQYSNHNAIAFYRTNLPSVVRMSSDRMIQRDSFQLVFKPKKRYACETELDCLRDIAIIKADSVFSPSYNVAEIVAGRCGIKVDVIESPFNPHICEESSTASEIEGKEYILTYGTMNLNKGITVIGECIYDILNKHKQLCYVFAGRDQGWQENGKQVSATDYIMRKAQKHADRVIILGKVSREKLFPVIRNALCCIFPYRFDNLSNAVIEAMALGNLVIGTEGSSCEQLIEDGISGILIEREKPQSLFCAVNRAVQMDENEKKGMIKNAKKRVERLSPDVIYNELIDYYGKVINGYRTTIMGEYYNKTVQKYNRMLNNAVGEARASEYMIEPYGLHGREGILK